MSFPNVLTRLRSGCTVIAPGDRSDLLPGLVLAHQSGTFPHLASIVLTGGYLPPDSVLALIDGVQAELPIIVSEHDTFDTATALAAVRGRLTAVQPGEDGDRAAGVRGLGGRGRHSLTPSTWPSRRW